MAHWMRLEGAILPLYFHGPGDFDLTVQEKPKLDLWPSKPLAVGRASCSCVQVEGGRLLVVPCLRPHSEPFGVASASPTGM